MAASHGDDGWLYHLPEFLDQLRERGAHSVRENVEVDIDGVLYHHRGGRVPAYNATFLWPDDEAFELELDAVGSRAAWVRFDATRDWDFFLTKAPGDAPCLAWMSDAEFRAEETEEFADKQESMAMMRFSFGLYLQSPEAWADVEQHANETDAACFVYRPSGRTLVPEHDITEYDSLLPPELLGSDEPIPPFLGVLDATLETD